MYNKKEIKINHGKRLEQLLLEMGISKKDFAATLDIMQPNLSHWLKEFQFSEERIKRVCDALGITINEFLSENTGGIVSETLLEYRANNEVMLLRELLNEKERTIKILLKQYCDENTTKV